MSVWTIRTAQESDIDQLTDLHLALQKYHEERNPQLWHLSANGRKRFKERFAQLLSDGDACVLVALDDSGTIVGMVVGQIRRDERYIPAISGSIGRLFVSEAWRGRGIGTELVKQLFRFFASRHVEDISIYYIAGNSEATQFWSKLGFQPRMVIAGTKLHDLGRRIAEAADKNVKGASS
jgi:ribosomal protein S18 acetylase RimI-like enzyme